jgi:hypothetical protein
MAHLCASVYGYSPVASAVFEPFSGRSVPAHLSWLVLPIREGQRFALVCEE